MILETQTFQKVLSNLYDGVYFVDEFRRIVYWSEAAQRITGYSEKDMVGSLCHDSHLSHLDEKGTCACMQGCHLTLSFRSRTTEEGDRFILHKNGHRIAVVARTVPMFDAKNKVTGAVQIFRPKYVNLATQEQFESLKEQALVDELTRLPNRRALEDAIDMRLEELVRYGRQFGIMFIDIDHFKRINDEHGHHVGDRALRLAADTLMNSIRPFDLLGRYGGEEFVGILVNVDEPELSKIVNRARILVEQSVLHLKDDEIDLTVSIGATLALPGDRKETLIERADQLMYQSKRAGRNRVSIIGMYSPKDQS